MAEGISIGARPEPGHDAHSADPAPWEGIPSEPGAPAIIDLTAYGDQLLAQARADARGKATATQDGAILGSPAYMPPERQEDASVQDPHRVVSCPGVPETFWCQHRSGIFRSGNDLASWEQLHSGLSDFGFAVAVHPTNPDIAWFVPAQSDGAARLARHVARRA